METFKILQIAIAIAGIINFFLVSVFLFFFRKGNTKSNMILCILLIAFCLKISFAFLLNIPHRWEVPSILLYYFSEAGYFAFGPLLYLYYRSFLKMETRKGITTLIFLPLLLPFIGHFLNYDIPLWMMQSYFLIFLILVFIQLKELYKEKNKYVYLKTEKFWLKALFGSFVLIWLTVNLLFFNFNMYFFELSVIIIIVFYIDIYLIITHYWFKQGGKIEIQKYKNSNLTEEEENDILLRLHKLMEHDKLYIDPEITLPKVAAIIGISSHKLSQVINKKMNMTFNEFINSKRINDIKNAIILPEFQDLKISSLAIDYGFNTISAFNTAFKRFTKYTPSQYRNMKILSN